MIANVCEAVMTDRNDLWFMLFITRSCLPSVRSLARSFGLDIDCIFNLHLADRGKLNGG